VAFRIREVLRLRGGDCIAYHKKRVELARRSKLLNQLINSSTNARDTTTRNGMDIIMIPFAHSASDVCATAAVAPPALGVFSAERLALSPTSPNRRSSARPNRIVSEFARSVG
jgi:hypothetical protein